MIPFGGDSFFGTWAANKILFFSDVINYLQNNGRLHSNISTLKLLQWKISVVCTSRLICTHLLFLNRTRSRSELDVQRFTMGASVNLVEKIPPEFSLKHSHSSATI